MKEEEAQISFMRPVNMIMTPKCEGHYKKKITDQYFS